MKKIISCILSLLILTSTACIFKNEKNFKGINIIFFAGGFKNDAISPIIYNGAKQAQQDFGCKVECIFSGWDQEKMLDDFKDAIEKKPDGICIMGHPGDQNLLPLVEEAVKKGIIVTSQNVNVSLIEEKFTDKGFGYVGQNTYKAGYSLAVMCRKKFNLDKNDKVLIWGTLNYNSKRSDRTKASFDALKESGIIPDYIEMTTAARANPLTDGFNDFNNYYLKNKALKLIIVDGGVLTASVPEILKKAGLLPGEIKCAGYDLTSGSLNGIKSGYINFINDQQPFLQGYLPVLQICLSKKYGFSGLHINTGSSFIDASNAVIFEKFIEQKIR